MPIVKEEQILLCRLLKRQISKSANRVIDVGTGSGVFGIYAAKVCAAKVIGIDISRRACDFARKNAALNDVKVCDDINSLRGGQIAILHEELSDFCRRQPRASVYILNPPFTPTIRDADVAIHARGGFDGQRAFEYQLRTLQPFLRAGDRIIGYQMTCGSRPDFGFRQILTDVMKHPFDAQSCPTIAGGQSLKAVAFLPAIYGAWPRSIPLTSKLSRKAKVVLKHFDQHGLLDKEFSLIAYVINIKKKGANQIGHLELDDVPIGTWADRIWLHQRILDGRQHIINPASQAFR
jgi:methylase of polypeptide subunit release factors